MSFALFFNVLALIVSGVASIILIIFVALLNGVNRDRCQTAGDDRCVCPHDGLSDRYEYESGTTCK
jgi:hypothetical protein